MLIETPHLSKITFDRTKKRPIIMTLRYEFCWPITYNTYNFQHFTSKEPHKQFNINVEPSLKTQLLIQNPPNRMEPPAQPAIYNSPLVAAKMIIRLEASV